MLMKFTIKSLRHFGQHLIGECETPGVKKMKKIRIMPDF